MRKLIAIAALFVSYALLAGCSVATQKLDDSTGTTKDQRCADYRGLLAASLLVQEQDPTDARAARIAYYRAFVESNCPEVK